VETDNKIAMNLPIIPPADLLDALNGSMTEDELRFWGALKPGQRDEALKRARAMTRWHDDRGEWTADDAARAAGVSRNRFYALAASWENEAERSLANLGVGAQAPRRRRSTFDADLLENLKASARAIVAREGSEGASVSVLAQELESTMRDDARKKPGTAVLRAMIVEARRHHQMHGGIGTDLAFDLCACQLSDEAGQPYVLFACIDRGTGFVLAYGFGDPTDSLMRHQALAAEVLERRGPDGDEKLPWTKQTERVELVVGLDRKPFMMWADAIRDDLGKDGKINLQPSIRPRRYGRYLREHFGAAIGRIRLLPASTRNPSDGKSATILTKERYSLEDALVRIGLEITDHNEAVLAKLGRRSAMPATIVNLLSKIARR
jgi:hypothetical protein